jgi:hypothetical protein
MKISRHKYKPQQSRRVIPRFGINSVAFVSKSHLNDVLLNTGNINKILENFGSGANKCGVQPKIAKQGGAGGQVKA